MAGGPRVKRGIGIGIGIRRPNVEVAEGERVVPFDVVDGGQTCPAFTVRFQGLTHAYLNRCAHIAMEMDFQSDRFFDASGHWLLRATHGAA